MAAYPTTIISHWNNLIEKLHASSQEFYAELESALVGRQLPGIQLSRVYFREGGILSAEREYLEVRRGEHLFHVCAAPFGTGFFVSWWLGEVKWGLVPLLSRMPLVGPLFARLIKPRTYYHIDTALMFQSATHGAVLDVIDGLTSAKGIRALAKHECKPVLGDFFRP